MPGSSVFFKLEDNSACSFHFLCLSLRGLINDPQCVGSTICFRDVAYLKALAPVLPSQQTNLHENVSSLLLDGHDAPNEVGETASANGPVKSADIYGRRSLT